MSLYEVSKCGFSFLFDYFRSEAWNENKIVQENDEKIREAVLKKIDAVIKSLNR